MNAGGFPQLVQIALPGTARQSLVPVATASTLGRLQAQVDFQQRERALYTCAALMCLHERIGRLPHRDLDALPAPCAAEQRPPVSMLAGSLLRRIQAGEHLQLLTEWLELAGHAGQLAPPETLPALLAAGAEKQPWQAAILPVLGERGRWLAPQNPEWAWVSGAVSTDDSAWSTGEFPARLSFLLQLRAMDPERARGLLEACWKEETPEERAAFIIVLNTRLSPADEPFLEAALDDKRKEVRRTAAALLSRLPESVFAQRMVARAVPLLKFTAAEAGSVLRLKKSKAAALEVTLPEACDKAMQRDGIELRPLKGFGEKASWLIQLLEATPLDTWTRAWQAAPGEIIAASLAGEWQKELLEAWHRAAVTQGHADWAEAVLAAALTGNRFDRFEALLAVLPPARCEARLGAILDADDSRTRELHGTLVDLARHPWSAGFSRSVLAWLQRTTAQPSTDWQTRNRLKEFAPRFSPEIFSSALRGWPESAPAWSFWSQGVDEFLSVIQFRSDLHQAFANPT